MKSLTLIKFILLIQLLSLNAFAGSFQVERVQPWGQYGFRATGTGNNLTEMRFDCSRASEMGIVLSLVNDYGKTRSVVMPAKNIGSNKESCQKNLKKYFAGINSNRSVASLKNRSAGMVEFNLSRGGLFGHGSNRNLVLR